MYLSRIIPLFLLPTIKRCGIRRRRKRTENSRCGSSVGRAKDWKSLCRRFDPAPHHKATLGNRVVFCFMYTVYILYSEKFNKHYSGFTSNMERRLIEHNLTAPSGYSIRFRPWVILHSESFEDKKEAMTLALWSSKWYQKQKKYEGVFKALLPSLILVPTEFGKFI